MNDKFEVINSWYEIDDNYEFTLNELKILYKLFEHQYISYEDTEALALIRKIRSIIDKFNEKS